MFSNSFRRVVFPALLCVGAAVLPASLIAQQSPAAAGNSAAQVAAPAATTAGVTTAETPTGLGPRIDSGPFSSAMQPSPLFDSAPAPASVPAPEGAHAGTNVAMMGVGAAAIVVGVLVGGDGGAIIAITGGVIGLIGLYRYLR